ncbi:MAG: potassium transporter [Candidatus Methanolliviera sp. GoM_asphalt]|nr:MAG: potassium transporter [Candidatus Methanolliviera sp. GoM_asphalt]
MNHRAIISTLGYIVFSIGIMMFFPLLVDIYYKEAIFEFLYPIAISIIIGSILILCFRTKKDERSIFEREAFLIVALGWLLAAIFGSLPYLFSSLPPIDSFFESMSGFTTTGSTILVDIEAYSRGLLFWRSMTQWLGGMGIIVLFLAVLPTISDRGSRLFKAETSFLTAERIRPKIRDTMRIFCLIYLLFSVIEVILLLLCRVPLYEAICTAFSTLSTGGFHPRADSIAYYQSPIVEFIVIIFMLIGSINFSLHFMALKGKIKNVLRNEELRFYLIILLVSIGIVTIDLALRIHGNFLISFRYAVFQVVSTITSTGFATIDFSSSTFWTPSSALILFILMFLGGCRGSTSGGIKEARIHVVIKCIRREFRRLLHPEAVMPIKYNGKIVSEDALHSIFAFVLLYFTVFAVAGSVLIFMGYDPITSLSSVATAMENFGPGLALVGPFNNYAFFNPFAKILLTFCMWVGRLEIFTVLIIFLPEFWRRY